jgi:signal peptidase I
MSIGKFFNKYKNTVSELFVVLVLALLFRSVVYEPYVVPSGSMLPTLIEGDRILISKFRYGISRYSFPLSPPLFKGRILEFRQPQRGDIIVFEKDKIYVKRLIGLPEDTVQVVNGKLYLNGFQVPKHKLHADFLHNGVRSAQYLENLPGGVTHTVLDTDDYSELDNTKVFTVPADHYFFMGDNRDDSKDSRADDGIGFVHKDELLGRVDLIIFSSPALKPYDLVGIVQGFKADRALKRVQ